MIPANRDGKLHHVSAHLERLSSLKARHVMTHAITIIEEPESTKTVYVDAALATDAANTYVTFSDAAAALGELSAGDVGVIQFVGNYTSVAVDETVNLAPAQKKFRKIIIRGDTITPIVSDVVSASAVSADRDTWVDAVGTTAGYTVSAFGEKLLKNVTSNSYYGILDNTINKIQTTAMAGSEVSKFYKQLNFGLADNDVNDRFLNNLLETYVAGDVIQVFVPATTWTFDRNMKFLCHAGNNIILEEIAFDFATGTHFCIVDDAQMIFRGCMFECVPAAPDYGPLSSNVTLDGCYAHGTSAEAYPQARLFDGQYAVHKTILSNCYFNFVKYAALNPHFYTGCYFLDTSIDFLNISLIISNNVFHFNYDAGWAISIFNCNVEIEQTKFNSAYAASKDIVHIGRSYFMIENSAFAGCSLEIIGSFATFRTITQTALPATVQANTGGLVVSASTVTFYGNCSFFNHYGIQAEQSILMPMNIMSCASCTSHGIYLINSSLMGSNNSQLTGAANGGYGVYLQGQSSVCAKSNTSITGTSGNCRLGASGAISWATIAAPASSADRNDYASATTENCSAYVLA